MNGRNAESKSPDVSNTDVNTQNEEKAPQAPVKIYLAKTFNKGIFLVPSDVTFDGKDDERIDFALNALINAKSGSDGDAVMPEGAKLAEPTTIKDYTAIVDFNKALIANFHGGSEMESLTLNAIAFTVVANSDETVKNVKILVEGKDVETLGGHFELFDPIVPDKALLAPKK